MPRSGRNKQPSSTSGRVRLIGGQWRHRSLDFPVVDAVRPTPDRVRETLFNWLAPTLPGSRCLDLFAGSGALGLEALSRGADHSTFVDSSSALTRALRRNLGILDAANGEVIESDVMTYLRASAGSAVDLVFLDPPFRAGLIQPVCDLLASRSWLRGHGHLYLEHESDAPEPHLPREWQLHRRKTAGQVCYSLYALEGSDNSR